MNKNFEQVFERINRIEELIVDFANTAAHSSQHAVPISEWMSLKEGAKYAGVSNNSFVKFRDMGLVVSEIGGIKRVSRKEIDRFLENNSY